MVDQSLDQSLKKFLNDKLRYEGEGFQAYWIFEATYLKELQELYIKKVIELEKRFEEIDKNPPKKLGQFLMCGFCKKHFDEDLTGVKIVHVASQTGFSKAKIVFINEESTREHTKLIKCRFLQMFKEIIASQEIVPDKSIVILNSEQAGLLKNSNIGEEIKVDKKTKKREKLSQMKGQKFVTDFFQSIKSSSVSKPYKKQPEVPRNIFEEIAHLLRGDNVKILTIPKLHYELNPGCYVSCFLLNEISCRISKDKKGLDIRTHCEEALTCLPNEIWQKVVDHVKICEGIYLEGESLKTNDEIEA